MALYLLWRYTYYVAPGRVRRTRYPGVRRGRLLGCAVPPPGSRAMPRAPPRQCLVRGRVRGRVRVRVSPVPAGRLEVLTAAVREACPLHR
eukprot:scaffold31897_cov58-Phaeocystis_antarctica.AAC.5